LPRATVPDTIYAIALKHLKTESRRRLVQHRRTMISQVPSPISYGAVGDFFRGTKVGSARYSGIPADRSTSPGLGGRSNKSND
jgi:hypothetical protein